MPSRSHLDRPPPLQPQLLPHATTPPPPRLAATKGCQRRRATTEQTPHVAATTDPATSALERHFRSIKHDLSCAAHRLDTSFDETSHDGNPHPLKLMRRINHLETVVGKLQRDWAQLEEDRERIVPAVRRYPRSLACHPPFAPYTASRSPRNQSHHHHNHHRRRRRRRRPQASRALMEQSQQIQALSTAAGCADPDYNQTVATVVAQLASAGLTDGHDDGYDAEETAGGFNGGEQPCAEDCGGAENVDPRAGGGNHSGSGGANRHAAAKGSAVANALDRETFEALPTSTRGRVTFETVSQCNTVAGLRSRRRVHEPGPSLSLSHTLTFTLNPTLTTTLTVKPHPHGTPPRPGESSVRYHEGHVERAGQGDGGQRSPGAARAQGPA